MELQRSRWMLGAAALFTLGGVVMLTLSGGGVVLIVIGGLSVLIGAAFVWSQLRSFLFVIGPAGLTLRTKGIDRLVSWDEIEAIILDRPVPSTKVKFPSHYLLLVQARGSKPAARDDLRSTADGAAGLAVPGPLGSWSLPATHQRSRTGRCDRTAADGAA